MSFYTFIIHNAPQEVNRIRGGLKKKLQKIVALVCARGASTEELRPLLHRINGHSHLAPPSTFYFSQAFPAGVTSFRLKYRNNTSGTHSAGISRRLWS
jgi:hypothetical protein